MPNFNLSLSEFEQLVYKHLVAPPDRFEGQPLFETRSGIVECSYISGTSLGPKVRSAIENIYIELIGGKPC